MHRLESLRAVPGLCEVRQRVLGEEEGRGQVDSEAGLPARQGHVADAEGGEKGGFQLI